MGYGLVISLSAAGLFAAMLVLLEIGRRVGARRAAADPKGARAGLGALEGALFALLGLLLAFTFSGATSRFDTRRQLILEETNAIGTAYLRLDLLAPGDEAMLRDAFRRYVDARIEAYRLFPNVEAAQRVFDRAMAMQGEIWRQAVAACRASGALPAAPTLLLPALNGMFDITMTRAMALHIHPPTIIFVMLFGIALVSALLAGFGMGSAGSRSWLHMICFSAAVAIAVYVIMDIEYPRLGLIRVETFDQALVDLRRTMK
jgi:hypothetical protein